MPQKTKSIHQIHGEMGGRPPIHSPATPERTRKFRATDQEWDEFKRLMPGNTRDAFLEILRLVKIKRAAETLELEFTKNPDKTALVITLEEDGYRAEVRSRRLDYSRGQTRTPDDSLLGALEYMAQVIEWSGLEE